MNIDFQGIKAVPVEPDSNVFRVRNPYSFIYLPCSKEVIEVLASYLVDLLYTNNRNQTEKSIAGKYSPHLKIVKRSDQTLRVARQRHGEWEGTFGFLFHRPSTQFVSGPDSLPLRWN